MAKRSSHLTLLALLLLFSSFIHAQTGNFNQDSRHLPVHASFSDFEPVAAEEMDEQSSPNDHQNIPEQLPASGFSNNNNNGGLPQGLLDKIRDAGMAALQAVLEGDKSFARLQAKAEQAQTAIAQALVAVDQHQDEMDESESAKARNVLKLTQDALDAVRDHYETRHSRLFNTRNAMAEVQRAVVKLMAADVGSRSQALMREFIQMVINGLSQAVSFGVQMINDGTEFHGRAQYLLQQATSVLRRAPEIEQQQLGQLVQTAVDLTTGAIEEQQTTIASATRFIGEMRESVIEAKALMRDFDMRRL